METSSSNHTVAQKVYAQLGLSLQSITILPRYVGEFPRLLKDTPAPRLSGECPWQSLPQKTKLLRAGVSLDRARAVNNGAGKMRSYYARVYAI